MNPIATALKKKIAQVGDYLSGTRRIDNEADPTSALNINKRRALQKRAESSFKPKPTSNGIGVGP